ncbi:MAG TPA: carboxypeptidase-like regulatory domain-containing protein [Candidatus Paceibacterota bacterium]|nr:carboxypeptidase-like regulatory domain-containing protein [Candidatus Paceibacterota bacterium]
MKTIRIIGVVVMMFVCAGFASAVGTTGYAWGENIGWLNWGTSQGAIDVPTSGALTGYVWGENIGWVSLNCSNTSSCGTVDYGVTNSGGTLSGYGWGENVGWISFSCSNTSSCGTVDYGVTIDGTTGDFSGFAWGENIGWVSLNCSNTSSCGTVDYKVSLSSVSPTSTPPPGGVVLPIFLGGPSASPVPSAVPSVIVTPPVGPTPPGATPPPTIPPAVSPPTVPPPGATPTLPPVPVVVPGPIMQAVNTIGNWLDSLSSAIFGPIGNACQGPLGVASCGATGVGTLAVVIGIIAALIQSETAAVTFSMLQVIGLKKRAKVWGTVYDSGTKRPIPFARVELLDAMRRVVETRFTDRDGRYGFVTSAQSLQQTELRVSIRVSKPGYRFPSVSLIPGTDYIVYDNVYRGGELTLRGDAPIHYNVPLDATSAAHRSLFDFGRGLIGTWGDRLLSLGFWIGLVLVPVNYYLNRSTTNLVILVLFFVSNGIRMFAMYRPYGITRDSLTGKPLAFALVILNNASGARAGFTVSDEYGRYILSGERGKDYELQAYTPANVSPQRHRSVRIRGRSRIGQRAWFTMTLNV